MIDGEPRVIERDGTPLVVDASGLELVTRRSSNISGERRYHRIDVEQFEQDGIIVPSCEQKTHENAKFRLRCRRDIDSNWTGCSFEDCYGAYFQGAADTSGPELATTLANMSVEEFDAQVADGNSLRTRGGRSD